MANMDITQRTQFDRAELSVPTTGVRVRSPRLVAAFTVIGLLVLAALVYTTVVVIEGWAQAVVLGVIVATTIGAMIAISPNRRA